MNESCILVLDDEASLRKILSAMLTAEGHAVETASTISQAKEIVRAKDVHVILSDLRLEREDGLQMLKWVKDEHPTIPVIILTAHGTVDSAVDAMKQGAYDYVAKPFERSELVRGIRKALLTYRYQASQFLRSPGVSFAGLSMIGSNHKMKRIYQLVDKVAPTDSTVLVTGESGTGKELIAQAIHEASPRAKAPFIKINCAAIPETLMESELFGYEKGAFTGAATAKPGRFELADGGTLFLDEIGEMSTEMQVKLLRVLQDGSFERVGGLRTLKVNVRLVTATNRDLEKEVREGNFREDLFYRLNVVPVSLPPLRDRRDDIPQLIAYFVHKFAERMKKPVPKVSPESLELLAQFPWPGNIRQLENVIERLIVMAETPEIVADQLPEEILEYEEERALGPGASLKDQVKEATRRIEKKAIEEALVETENNVTRAAKKLNISRKGLQLKMKELGIR
jgi:two-component system, NtrC family, response regulator AtoC